MSIDATKIKSTPSKSAGKNSGLTAAKSAKNDEFYTQLTDVEKEMRHYEAHFRGRVIYCNCDDARESKFFHYFSYKFEVLGLKKLIAVGYKEGGKGVYYEYNGDKNGNRVPDAHEIEVWELEGNGDFRSAECIEILKGVDIVVTNPPFSLFREYVQQLVGHNKKFIIVGNMNAVTYKEVFKLIKSEEIWLGISPRSMTFTQPDGSTAVVNSTWFTNLPHRKRTEEFISYKHFSLKDFPMYDNYFAYNVDKVKEIPLDKEVELLIPQEMCEELLTKGVELEVLNKSEVGNLVKFVPVWGVPITYLDKHNPSQFEIVGCSYDYGRPAGWDAKINMSVSINGVNIYKRILIKPIINN